MKVVLAMLFASLAAQAQLVPFEKGDLWGYKDRHGKVAIEPRYPMAGRFSRGIAPVVIGDTWAYIDSTGKVIVRPFVYDNGPDYFHEGLARYVEDRKIGFFDRHGRIVIKAQFDFAEPFSHGRAKVCQGCRKVAAGEHFTMEGGKWGFIDRAGRLVIPFADAKSGGGN
jgi:hypothetical protein